MKANFVTMYFCRVFCADKHTTWGSTLPMRILNENCIIDHSEFISNMNQFLSTFSQTFNFFITWIIFSFVFNLITIVCFSISSYYQLLTSHNGCHLDTSEFIHYWCECAFYLISLLMVFLAMAYNQSILTNYKNHFIKRVVYTLPIGIDASNDRYSKLQECALREKTMIESYLKCLVDDESPFGVCGVAPTYVNILQLFSTVFVTFVINVVSSYCSEN